MSKADDKIYERLGENIRYYRKRIGMSQDKLAAKVGLERTSIVNTEAGNQRPGLHVIAKIAKALKVESRDLLRDVIRDKIIRPMIRSTHSG